MDVQAFQIFCIGLVLLLHLYIYRYIDTTRLRSKELTRNKIHFTMVGMTLKKCKRFNTKEDNEAKVQDIKRASIMWMYFFFYKPFCPFSPYIPVTFQVMFKPAKGKRCCRSTHKHEYDLFPQ